MRFVVQTERERERLGEWAPGPVWSATENIASRSHRDWISGPSSSESLYRLSYRGPSNVEENCYSEEEEEEEEEEDGEDDDDDDDDDEEEEEEEEEAEEEEDDDYYRCVRKKKKPVAKTVIEDSWIFTL